MRDNILQPRVLLLNSLEYHRIESKLSSLETHLTQGARHIKQLVRKVKANKPDVVVVEKSANMEAQQELLKANVSLVINVKPAIMARLERAMSIKKGTSETMYTSDSAVRTCTRFCVKSFMPIVESESVKTHPSRCNHLSDTVNSD